MGTVITKKSTSQATFSLLIQTIGARNGIIKRIATAATVNAATAALTNSCSMASKEQPSQRKKTEDSVVEKAIPDNRRNEKCIDRGTRFQGAVEDRTGTIDPVVNRFGIIPTGMSRPGKDPPSETSPVVVPVVALCEKVLIAFHALALISTRPKNQGRGAAGRQAMRRDRAAGV